MLDLQGLITEFFATVRSQEIEIYNEFSFQHELGIYLRNELPDYKVQFERNVAYFLPGANTIKKEIDIAVFNKDKRERYAFELKYPNNGQYPAQMYSFVKDIKFMEELKALGFTKTCCVVLVSDRPFYQGNINEGIYRYFREEFSVYGDVFKHTGQGKGEEYISLAGR